MNYLIYSDIIRENISTFYNLENVEKSILANITNDNYNNNIYIIFPTNKLCIYKEKDFIKKLWELHKLPYRDKVYFNFNEFLKIIKNILNIEINKIPLKEEEFYALMEIAYKNVDFKYFSKNKQILPKKITNLLSDIIWGLIKKGIRINDLENDFNNSDNKIQNKDKLIDIINIYKEVEKLYKKDFYTDSDLIDLIINKINKDNFIFNDNRVFYLQYFKEFKHSEINLIKLLFEKELKLIINFDFLNKYNPQENVLSGLNNLITKNVNTEFINNTNIINNHISEYLFNYKELNRNKEIIKIDVDSNISIYNSLNKETEIEFITKLVKKLIITDNILPKDIYIFARNPNEYSQKLKNSFDENLIPLNISDRFNLKESPIINLVINYFEFINSGFNNKHLFKIIKSPWFNIDNLDKYKFLLSTNKFRINYNLKNRIDSIDNLITKIYSSNSNSDNDKNNLINELNKLKLDTNNIFNILKINGNDKYYSKEEIKIIIINLLSLINFDNVFKTYKDINIDEDEIEFHYFYLSREKERIFSAINTFIKNIENILTYKLKHNKLDKINIQEFLDSLYFNLDKDRFQIRELYDTSVTFTSIEQGRGIDRKVSILCGAVEGQFPLHYQTDDILGLELKNSENLHTIQEEEQFYEFLFPNGRLSENIIITYPNNNNGSDLIVSHFIKDLFNLIININIYEDKYVNQFINKYKLIDKIHYLDDNKILEDLKNTKLNGELFNLSTSAINYIEEAKTKSYSVSRLDKMKNYPYEYFLNSILKLYSKDNYGEEIERNEKGIIHHNILSSIYSQFTELIKLNNNYDFYLKSINSNINNIYPVDVNKINNYQEIINSEIEKEFNNFPENEFFNFEKDLTYTLINKFIENEKKLLDKFKLFPSIFELPFGDNELLKFTELFNNKNYNFQGRVDRIDLNYVDGVLYFGIVDYKSSLPDVNSIEKINNKGKHSYQMYLYLIAIKKILINNYKIVFNNNEVNITEDNIKISYAYYYPLNDFTKQLIYSVNKLHYLDIFGKVKYELNEDNLKIQQEDLTNTLINLENNNFKYNGNKNEYNLEYDLMIR